MLYYLDMIYMVMVYKSLVRSIKQKANKHGQQRRTIIQGAIGRGGSYVHNINNYYNNKVMYDQTQR